MTPSRHQGILFGGALALFSALTVVVAIQPALTNEANNAPLPGSAPLGADALEGRHIFVAEGCVACHTQQVRGVEMDKPWGRPSVAADYAAATRLDLWRNTATLMGTARIGPDLANVGNRQPSEAWHLMHLFQPRSVVAVSIMPAYPWLFEARMQPGADDVVVSVPDEFKPRRGVIVATPRARHLVAYLLALKQAPLPDGGLRSPAPAGGDSPAAARTGADGATLYANNCQACHQPNGLGLKGAFPPLKDSPIVLADNPAVLLEIIMHGYSGRVSEGFAVMPPVGTMAGLDPAQVRAIANHARTSWGNRARLLSQEEVSAAIRPR